MRDWSEEQLERYSRQIILPEIGAEGQEKLMEASVAVVGAGGLGSVSLMYLATAGVGRLGIIEFDKVDQSNLQRQIIHNEGDLGKYKVDSALEKLSGLNGEVVLEAKPLKLDINNIDTLLTSYDFIIDGSDNFSTKFLLNDWCVRNDKPLSLAGILKYEGQITTIVPGQSPCYRCLFPAPPEPGTVPSCASAGILGPVAGVLGSMQALEALKWICGIGELLTGYYLTLDLQTMIFQKLKFSKNENCPGCSKSAPEKILTVEGDICHE